MQVNRINNNVDFKAKAKVNISDDFLVMFGLNEPKIMADFVEKTADAVKLLKKVAPQIGTEKDVLELRSYRTKELDLMHGHSWVGTVSEELDNPVEGMVICLKAAAERLNKDGDKNILAVIKDALKEKYVLDETKGIVGFLTKKAPSQAELQEMPKPLTIRGYKEELRKLNQTV